MSARSEIERHQHSLDSRRPQYQKRSTSLSALRSNYVAADIEMEDLSPQLLDIPRVPVFWKDTRNLKCFRVPAVKNQFLFVLLLFHLRLYLLGLLNSTSSKLFEMVFLKTLVLMNFNKSGM